MKYLFAIFLNFFLLTSALAGDDLYLTIDKAIEKALLQNPSINSAHEETKAAKARVALSAAPEDPSVGVMFEEVPINTADPANAMTRQYFFQQKIPFPARIVSAYKAGKNAALAQEAWEKALTAEIIKKIKYTYAELIAKDEAINIAKETATVFKIAKGAAETSYASGISTIADPVKASIELGTIENDLARLNQEKMSAVAMLESLMNQPIGEDTKFKKPAPPVLMIPYDELLDKMKSGRPEITESEKTVKEGKAKLSYARQLYLPDLMTEFRYVERPNQRDAWTGTLGISLPLYGFIRQRNEVRSAKALLKAAKERERETILEGQALLKDAYERVKASERIIRTFKNEIVPRASIAAKSSQEAYRAQKIDFLTLASAVKDLYTAKLLLIDAESNHIKAFADVERLLGETGGSL